MPEDKWQYAEMKPHFSRAGEFTAWCAGSGKTNSAAAWRVERNDGSEVPIEDEQVSKGESTAQRGVLAAAVGSIESLQPQSKLVIKTTNEYLADAINGNIQKWKLNGWRRLGGLVSNLNIIKRIDGVIDRRSITVCAVHCKKGSGTSDDKILTSLTKRANACRGKQP